MGLFNKNKPTENTQNEEFDPVVAAAVLIARTDYPVLSLGALLVTLLQSGSINSAALEVLGVSEDEIIGLMAALQEGESAEEILYDLEVRAAGRQYDKELALLAARRGIEQDTDLYTEFRSAVARFALDNEITNMSAAYRLMRAENPDSIPG
jgi:hypothetical protein